MPEPCAPGPAPRVSHLRDDPRAAIPVERDDFRELEDLTTAPRFASGTGRQTASARTPVARPSSRLLARSGAPPLVRSAVPAAVRANPVAASRASRSLPAALVAASSRAAPWDAASSDGEANTVPTVRGMPPIQRPARPAPRLTQTCRRTVPDLPGFGEYLVAQGILTRERLRVAQAYERSMKVQLSTAIITLGFATPQRIEWAAVAYQSQLGAAAPVR